ncbi:MAG: VOC family protein [Carboxylicivirga sp.]|jgi:predicted enzyme related to lactoylglutathione lyase|nr:VOC family protein [Carboxylicivirga sp.]
MILNNPIFSDLSTYNPKETIPFYENVFGWTYYQSYGYYTAYLNSKEVSGLYETPAKFKQMRMPHFWMTYISVDNVDETVSKAQKLGGIIEMTESIDGFGKVALIRDLQGAGFTIYEGNSLGDARTQNTPNTLVWNELHVSNIQNIVPFYQGIFNWSFEFIGEDTVQIYNQDQDHIADILEIPNEMKGKYEYWISCFGVSNLEETHKAILENGGSLISDEGKRKLFTDNSGQAFFYVSSID